MLVGFGHIHVHVYTYMYMEFTYIHTYTISRLIIPCDAFMISRGLFPRLQWWGRERGGDDGGRGRRGIREEEGGNVCW